jgi:hypothetical protein
VGSENDNHEKSSASSPLVATTNFLNEFPNYPISHSIEEWEKSVLGTLGTVRIDYNLTKPHRLFRYPDFPLLEKSQSDHIESFLKEILWRADPERVRLFPTFEVAIETFFEGIKKTSPQKMIHVASIAPHLPEFLRISSQENSVFKIFNIPKDPEQWVPFFENQIDILLLSHPNFGDGFAWPQSFFSKFLMEAEKRFSNLIILVDPRNTLFSLDSVPAGRIEPVLQAKQLEKIPVFIVDSIFPIRSPTGPGTSWILPLNQSAKDRSELLPDSMSVQNNELIQCARSLMAFLSRQGPAMAEFSRRILVLQRSLRAFADQLMPFSRAVNPKIRVPYWPTQGFMLKMDLGFAHSPENSHVKSLDTLGRTLEMARNFSILAIPGEIFACPGSLFINYALPLNHAEKASVRLSQALTVMLQ